MRPRDVMIEADADELRREQPDAHQIELVPESSDAPYESGSDPDHGIVRVAEQHAAAIDRRVLAERDRIGSEQRRFFDRRIGGAQ